MKFSMTRAVGYLNFAIGIIVLINQYGQPFSIAVASGLCSLVLGCLLLGMEYKE